MKILRFLFGLCLITALGYGQAFASCLNCNNSGNIISSNNNGTYTAAGAQAYYWEICSGNAIITNGQTSGTVTVDCSGDFTLKVTRFTGGSCYEACETYTCNVGSGGCPDASNLFLAPFGCTEVLVSHVGVSNIDYVNYTWEINGFTNTITNASSFLSILLPPATRFGSIFRVCTTVFLNDGTQCPEICRTIFLECDGDIRFRERNNTDGEEAGLFPNPARNSFAIQNNRESEIQQISINNAQGALIRSVKNYLNQEIDMSGERNGTYYIRILYSDGTTEMKKLVIEH